MKIPFQNFIIILCFFILIKTLSHRFHHENVRIGKRYFNGSQTKTSLKVGEIFEYFDLARARSTNSVILMVCHRFHHENVLIGKRYFNGSQTKTCLKVREIFGHFNWHEQKKGPKIRIFWWFSIGLKVNIFVSVNRVL